MQICAFVEKEDANERQSCNEFHCCEKKVKVWGQNLFCCLFLHLLCLGQTKPFYILNFSSEWSLYLRSTKQISLPLFFYCGGKTQIMVKRKECFHFLKILVHDLLDWFLYIYQLPQSTYCNLQQRCCNWEQILLLVDQIRFYTTYTANRTYL